MLADEKQMWKQKIDFSSENMLRNVKGCYTPCQGMAMALAVTEWQMREEASEEEIQQHLGNDQCT